MQLTSLAISIIIKGKYLQCAPFSIKFQYRIYNTTISLKGVCAENL